MTSLDNSDSNNNYDQPVASTPDASMVTESSTKSISVATRETISSPQEGSAKATSTTTTTTAVTNSNTNGTAVWDAVAQIYVGGQVASTANANVQELIAENQGSLPIFGYGSLCWKPGGILAHPTVTTQAGKAWGYRRCWAQKSADHRGLPQFPGIVCTLLQEEEVQQLLADPCEHSSTTTTATRPKTTSRTEGVLYTVPPSLVDTCLEELDFREKGGYARDIIQVTVDHDDSKSSRNGSSESSLTTRHALLYRGTPDNPAIWLRVLRDKAFAAAVLAVSIGPSGRNDEYLNNLNEFLKQHQEGHELEDDDTMTLADMVHEYQTRKIPMYFLHGAGSNQHNQLLLNSHHEDNNVAGLVPGNGGDAHELKEILLCGTPSPPPLSLPTNNTNANEQQLNQQDLPKRVYAGGGNSAVLTTNGSLYLFGWNERGQCGTNVPSTHPPSQTLLKVPVPLHPPLSQLRVENCDLGFHHTLLIEKETGLLWAMGDNSRGQVDGGHSSSGSDMVDSPIQVPFLSQQRFVEVACGLHHSAAITCDGEVVVFGCGRYGQALSQYSSSSTTTTATSATTRDSSWTPGRWWKPENGAKLVKVACGRRHTVVLDENGVVYTFGDNKYGQLGRPVSSTNQNDLKPTASNSNETTTRTTNPYPKQQLFDSSPQRVRGPWEEDGNLVVCDIQCGWSHTVVLVRHKNSSGDSPLAAAALYGFGRNDKGQLGLGETSDKNDPDSGHIGEPVRIFESVSFQNETQQQQPESSSSSLLLPRAVACGSEFTLVLDQEDHIWGCGWNEHGNLARSPVGKEEEEVLWTPVPVVRKDGSLKVTNPPGNPDNAAISLAAGGAHFLAMRVVAN